MRRSLSAHFVKEAQSGTRIYLIYFHMSKRKFVTVSFNSEMLLLSCNGTKFEMFLCKTSNLELIYQDRAYLEISFKDLNTSH